MNFPSFGPATPVAEVLQPGPSTFRPSMTIAELVTYFRDTNGRVTGVDAKPTPTAMSGASGRRTRPLPREARPARTLIGNYPPHDSSAL